MSEVQSLEEAKRIEEYINSFDRDEERFSNPSKLFRLDYFVGVNQKIDKVIFFDSGRTKDYRDYSKRKVENVDAFFDTTVSDPQNDRVLVDFLEGAKQKYSVIIPQNEPNRETLDEKVKSTSRLLASEVVSFFGGLDGTTVTRECEKTITQLKTKRKSNIIYLGDLKGYGLCRHRSILFKLLCDIFGVECRILRGWIKDQTGKNYAHMWNEVVLSRNHYLTVDSMNFDDFVPQHIVSEHYRNLGHSKKQRSADEISIQNVKKIYTSSEVSEPLQQFHLGTGAFGKVYEIRNVEVVTKYTSESNYETLDMNLAIKEVNLTEHFLYSGEEEKERIKRAIRREIDRMTLLQHPNITRVFGSFTVVDDCANTIVRVVMKKYDLCGQKFLLRKLKQQTLSAEKKTVEVLIFLLEVAKGLKYIHSFGIVHYDIKPQNILLNWDEEKNVITECVISDFGSSKEEKMNLNMTSSPSITRKFAAPETLQIVFNSSSNGGICTPKDIFTIQSDIFSYGVLMGCFKEYYEVFPQLIQIQQKCLEKNPVQRPSMIEVIYYLRSSLNHKMKKKNENCFLQLQQQMNQHRENELKMKQQLFELKKKHEDEMNLKNEELKQVNEELRKIKKLYMYDEREMKKEELLRERRNNIFGGPGPCGSVFIGETLHALIILLSQSTNNDSTTTSDSWNKRGIWEIEVKIRNTLQYFRFLGDNLDQFYHYYVHLLVKRLLMGFSRLEDEIWLHGLLKREFMNMFESSKGWHIHEWLFGITISKTRTCSYTKQPFNITSMFQSIRSSRDLCGKFYQYMGGKQRNNDSTCNTSHPQEFEVKVLDQEVWKMLKPNINTRISLHPFFRGYTQHFEEFFKKNVDEKKKLKWVFAGTNTVKMTARFESGTQFITVNGVQAVILDSFNEKDIWTMEEIKEKLGIVEGGGNWMKYLRKISSDKVKILRRGGLAVKKVGRCMLILAKTKEEGEGHDSIVLNEQYIPKKRRMDLRSPNMSNHEFVKMNEMQVMDRLEQVKAAATRIMKRKGHQFFPKMARKKVYMKNDLFSVILNCEQYLGVREAIKNFGPTKWERIFRASEHGFTSKRFHSKCDNISGTLVIIKSDKDNVFGGWNPYRWNQVKDRNSYDSVGSWIFGFQNKREFKKLVYKKDGKGIYCNSSSGPCFGYSDIGIFDDCDTDGDNYTVLESYVSGEGSFYKHFLNGGTKNFNVKDYEVFRRK